MSSVETIESSIGTYMSNYEISTIRHSIVIPVTRTMVRAQRWGDARGPELDARSERLPQSVEPCDVPNIHLRCDEAIVSI